MDDTLKSFAAKLLRDAEDALPFAEWSLRAPTPEDAELASAHDDPTLASAHDARFYKGSGGGYEWTLASFSIAEQGFPPGSRGYDGMVVKGVFICRLPRELATKACLLAETAATR